MKSFGSCYKATELNFRTLTPHALKGKRIKDYPHTPWRTEESRITPHALKGQKLSNTRQLTKLLPLQGALLTAIIPRAMPWARSFCPFRACCFWPLPLLYPSASDFQFRYAPVTIGSGRAASSSFRVFSPYLNHMRKLSIICKSKHFSFQFQKKQYFFGIESKKIDTFMEYVPWKCCFCGFILFTTP